MISFLFFKDTTHKTSLLPDTYNWKCVLPVFVTALCSVKSIKKVWNRQLFYCLSETVLSIISYLSSLQTFDWLISHSRVGFKEGCVIIVIGDSYNVKLIKCINVFHFCWLMLIALILYFLLISPLFKIFNLRFLNLLSFLFIWFYKIQ